MLNDQGASNFLEVSCISDAGLNHRAFVAVETCEIEKHVGSVTFTEHDLGVEFP